MRVQGKSGRVVPMTDTTGELLLGTARQLRRRFGAAMAGAGVTPAQGRALRIVCEHHSVRLSVLAEHLRIAPRSATEVVDALEEAGLVRRVADPDDRRATCVEPTDEGRERAAALDEVRREATEEFLAVLPARDRRTLDRILRQLGEG